MEFQFQSDLYIRKLCFGICSYCIFISTTRKQSNILIIRDSTQSNKLLPRVLETPLCTAGDWMISMISMKSIWCNKTKIKMASKIKLRALLTEAWSPHVVLSLIFWLNSHLERGGSSSLLILPGLLRSDRGGLSVCSPSGEREDACSLRRWHKFLVLEFYWFSMGRSPGEGNGNPLQHSCLENPMDRGVPGSSPGGSREFEGETASAIRIQ